MYKTFIFIVANLIAVAKGSSYENNKTNVGVYANHISSCNLDHKFGDMLCINRDYESVIQYHDVRAATFCPYHYCVTFRLSENKLACTGYSYLKMSGSMSEHINPLSPNDTALAFSGEGDAKNIKIGSSFQGYNILIDYFRQSVETEFENSIVDVQCSEPLTTCVYMVDGSKNCFGATDINFFSFMTSIVLGIVVPGSLSFACYIILWVTSKKYKCASNGCVVTITTPIVVEVCCMLILFVAADFIVKVWPFLLASIIGIWVGKLLCDMISGCFGAWQSRVGDNGDTYGSGERDGMLHNSRKKSESQFVIDDTVDDTGDDGMTEIELGSIKAEEDDNQVKRI